MRLRRSDPAVAGTGSESIDDLLDAFTWPAWFADGLCLEPAYAEVQFFPELGQDPAPAKAVCARCLARDDCLDYALEQRIDAGVWGATSPTERRVMLRARRAA